MSYKHSTHKHESEDEKKDEGIKSDSCKLDWSLLDLNLLRDTVKVLEFGEKKYSRDNWKKVDNFYNRYYSALIRHINAYNSGQHFDSETNISHLSHAMCNLLFLVWGEKNSKGINDENDK